MVQEATYWWKGAIVAELVMLFLILLVLGRYFSI